MQWSNYTYHFIQWKFMYSLPLVALCDQGFFHSESVRGKLEGRWSP